MTIIVYQDGKLYTDTTAFTDFSDSIEIEKWGITATGVVVCAGLLEDITAFKAEDSSYDYTELAAVYLTTDSALLYRENNSQFFTVIKPSEPNQPVMFGNNALRAVARTFMATKYQWDKPLMIEMVDAGIFPAVVELSPIDGLHYMHTVNGSSILVQQLT